MSDDRAWLFPVLRALPTAVVALTVTFIADHSVFLGFLALGCVALTSGVVITLGTIRGAYPRSLFLPQGALLVVGGIAAFATTWAGLPFLLFLTSGLTGVTGIMELVSGLRARGRVAAARDWVFVGAATALFAVVVLLIPADFVQAVGAPGDGFPPLTASVILVGSLGAYAAIVAVYLVIAGLSLKWASPTSTTVLEA